MGDRHPCSTTSSAKGRIGALLALINSSTQDAVAEYVKAGHGVPSSLDTEAHPMDTVPDALALKKAIRVLEGACEQLCSTLAQPMHTLVNYSMSFEAACMRLVVELKIADILRLFPDGLHVDKIAAEAGVDAGKLVQTMRLLAVRGCFKEVTPNVFANNRLSLPLMSSSPISSLVAYNVSESLRAVCALPDMMTDPDYAFSKEKAKSAFMYSVRDEIKDSEAGLFEWFQMNPEKEQRFNRAMVGGATLTGSLALVNHYPWGDLPAGTTFCDVGSGVGSMSILVARANPHMKFTLQDLPGAIEAAKSFWNEGYPEAVQKDRVDFLEIDFLKESPVKGQDVYYMKNILHDWPDSDALNIMKRVSEGMHPNSRLLIHEHVLQYACERNNSGIERAPEPLLPNYGSGKKRLYYADVNMLGLANAKERTYEEFVDLGAQSGLRLHQVWDLADFSVLEFRPQA